MRLLPALLQLYMFLIILRVFLSWVRPWPRTQVETVLYEITEPVLAAVRRVVPPFGRVDLSPIIVITLITLLRRFLFR